MLSKTKSKANSPSTILKITARYIGACPCGALIEPGDDIQYDTSNHQACCYQCGRERSESGATTLPKPQLPAAAQDSIDRFRMLRALAGPPSAEIEREMRAILDKFDCEYSMHNLVRQFIGEVADCSDNNADFVAIKAKYRGFCRHCQNPILESQLCLYDRESRRLHCLRCDCLKSGTTTPS